MTFKYFNVKNGLTTGEIALHSSNGNVIASNFVGNLNVTDGANLGNVSNLVITGGAANYVLSTDGAGNLSWVAQSGGGGSSNSITNGNTSVSIPQPDGNILLRVSEFGNIAVVSANGINVTGNLSATGLLTAANASLGNTASANFLGGTLTTAAQPNITSLGTLSGLTVSGISNLGANGNVIITGGTVGQVLTTDGAGNLTWTDVEDGASISNGTSNVDVAPANGNVSISVSGNANVVVVTGTGMNVTGYSNTTGNITGGGNLNISGNAVIGGNLTVDGNLIYVNVTDLSVEDPIIQLQTGPNGAAPTSNSGKDVGTALNYYDSAAKIAWMGWDTSNAEIAFGSNVGISSEVVTFTELANIRAGNANLGNAVSANFFVGNGSLLTGITAVSAASIANGTSNVTIPAANGNVNISAAGNANVLVVTGTGVNVSGTLDATGNLTAANASLGNVASANFLTGTLTTASQPNITSVGTLGSLAVTGDITAGNANLGNAVTANFYIGNGSLLTGVTSYAIANGNSNVSIPVANGNINFSAEGNANVFVLTGRGAVLNGNIQTGNGTGGNITGANIISAQTINASAALNVTGTSNLGPVGNVIITGGSNGQVLQTNGSGVLTWATVSTAGISNGTSNVSIPAVNGNVNISAAGNANVVVVTGTGANITGTANVTGDIVGGGNLNISGSAVLGNLATANFLQGTLTTASQPNITSVGTLSSLAVTGNITGGNANLGNLAVANFFSGTLTTAAQPNITSIGTLGSLAVTGNITAGNANLGNAVTANFYIGDGGLLTNISASTSSISNGNSNVSIPAANGDVVISAAGNANIVTVTGTGANITGNLNVSSNLAVTGRSNLGAVGNVVITGGTANYVLSTDGAGNLSWVAQTGGGGGGTPGGTNTQVQFNDAGNFAGNAGFTFNKTTTTLTANNFVATSTANLGAVGNVTITGGSSGLVLTTNGSGGLSWGTVGTAVTVDDFMGSGSQTAFTLSTIPAGVDYTLVSVAGTFQPRAAYTLSGNVLTFTSAPPATAIIEVTTLAAAAVAGPDTGSFVTRSYTANGAQNTFTVTNGVTANSVLVMENGIVQEPGTDYSVAGSTLTFTTAPAANTAIQIREIPSPNTGGGGATWASASANVTASANTKYIVDTSSANIVITLPGSPAFGMEVGVIDGTGNANTNAITVYGNGANIQGSNSNMTVNTSRAAFTLVYYNAAQGWLLTNV